MRKRALPRRAWRVLLAAGFVVGSARGVQGQQPALAASSAADSTTRAVVAGLITDAAGAPVGDAEVVLVDESRGMRTAANGLFQINRVPPGVILLDVRRLGFKEELVNLEVRPADTLRVHITLAMLATPLAPVIVEATRRLPSMAMQELEDRRRRGVGSQMTRSQIDSASNAFYLTDLLRRMRGIQLVPTRNGHFGVQAARGSCAPAVYLDGIVMPGGEDFLETLLASQIQALEVYIGSSEIPPKYLTMSNGCGVILVWTRHGR